MTRRDLRQHSRLRSAALVSAALIAMATATGCAVHTADGPQAYAGSATGAQADSSGTRQIVLRFDQQVVPATLTDSAAAREFAALLPLTLELADPMGQAKSGRLPAPLDTSSGDTGRTTDPAAGGIYYVPGSGTIAIFYADLGQSVPDGLIRLGAVDSDLPAVAAAGRKVLLRIYLTDHTSS